MIGVIKEKRYFFFLLLFLKILKLGVINYIFIFKDERNLDCKKLLYVYNYFKVLIIILNCCIFKKFFYCKIYCF